MLISSEKCCAQQVVVRKSIFQCTDRIENFRSRYLVMLANSEWVPNAKLSPRSDMQWARNTVRTKMPLHSTPFRKLGVHNDCLLAHFCLSDPHKICCILHGIFGEIKFKV